MSYEKTGRNLQSILLNEKSYPEGYILSGPNDKTLWKRSNCEDSKKISGCPGVWGVGGGREEQGKRRGSVEQRNFPI